MYSDLAVNKYLLTLVSSWIFINIKKCRHVEVTAFVRNVGIQLPVGSTSFSERTERSALPWQNAMDEIAVGRNDAVDRTSVNFTRSVQEEEFAHLLHGNSFSTTSPPGVRFVSSLSCSLRNLLCTRGFIDCVIG